MQRALTSSGLNTYDACGLLKGTSTSTSSCVIVLRLMHNVVLYTVPYYTGGATTTGAVIAKDSTG